MVLLGYGVVGLWCCGVMVLWGYECCWVMLPLPNAHPKNVTEALHHVGLMVVSLGFMK